MRKCLVLGIYTECIAEHARVSEFVLDAVCNLITLSGNNIKRIYCLKLALVVLVAEHYKLYTKILCKTVGCKLNLCLVCTAVNGIVGIECV